MNARIKKDDLIAFKAQGSNIKANGMSPILAYLKIEIEGDFCAITKSNNKCFIVKTIGNDSEDCCFLVDENVLNCFVEYSDSEYINFSIEGTRIVLSDGRSKAISQTENYRGYPPIDLSNEEWKVIPKAAQVAAGLCANIIFDGEVFNAKSFVFMGAGCVAASDGSVGYYTSIKEELPQVPMRKEVAQAISKMSSCRYSSNKSYNLFFDGDTLFGFIKDEIRFFDFNLIFNDFKKVDNADAPPTLHVNKNLIIKFNKLCTTSSSTKGLAASFLVSPNNMSLEMVDSKLAIDIHSSIGIKGESGEFKFDPSLLSGLLACVPSEEITLIPGDQRYWITDIERSFVAVIMLII